MNSTIINNRKCLHYLQIGFQSERWKFNLKQSKLKTKILKTYTTDLKLH